MNMLSVLVGYRSDGGRRDRIWSWIERRLRVLLPDAEIIVGASSPGPFNKAEALNRAAVRATGDTFLIVDADTAIDPDWLDPAFACCDEGNPCVHNTVHYLTEIDSDVVLDGPPDARLPVPGTTEYSGRKSWGGAVLLPRYLYELVRGQETRFLGWGPEDVAFALGLMGMGHCPIRLEANLIHLWHPTGPVKRPWGENHRALLTRYETAVQDLEAMTALIAEKSPLSDFRTSE